MTHRMSRKGSVRCSLVKTNARLKKTWYGNLYYLDNDKCVIDWSSTNSKRTYYIEKKNRTQLKRNTNSLILATTIDKNKYGTEQPTITSTDKYRHMTWNKLKRNVTGSTKKKIETVISNFGQWCNSTT